MVSCWRMTGLHSQEVSIVVVARRLQNLVRRRGATEERHKSDLVCSHMQEGKHAVTSAGEEVSGARSSRVTTDRIVLNHYVTKSLEQYQQKMERGSGMGNRKSMEFFQLTQLMATERCTYAVHLGERQQSLTA